VSSISPDFSILVGVTYLSSPDSMLTTAIIKRIIYLVLRDWDEQIPGQTELNILVFLRVMQFN
jgi:hypothetical protein